MAKTTVPDPSGNPAPDDERTDSPRGTPDARSALVGERIVLTGGPGGGKSAVLEVLRWHFDRAFGFLPEAASIVFGGGFPRRPTLEHRRAAQRAIYHVQRELESLAEEPGWPRRTLCDRGTLDGVAYWPEDEASYFRALGTSREAELSRYATVIHLRTPDAAHGYDHSNPLRTESAEEAARIDERIFDVWRGHPRRLVVANHREFLEKAREVVDIVRAL
ncbi:MAG: ATP-binding protein [Polyangiaceae bacterium]